MRVSKMMREIKRVVRMIIVKVKKKGKRPNNMGDPKRRMTPYFNLNHNRKHKPNTPILRWGAPLPHPSCLLM